MSITQNSFGQYFPELLKNPANKKVKFKVDGKEYDGEIKDRLDILIPKLPKKYFDLVGKKKGDELLFSEFLEIFEGIVFKTAYDMTIYSMKNPPKYTIDDVDELHTALLSDENKEVLELLKKTYCLSDDTISDYKIGYEQKTNSITIPLLNYTKSGVFFVIKYEILYEILTLSQESAELTYLFGYHELLTSEYKKEPIFVTEDIIDTLLFRQLGFSSVAVPGDITTPWLEMIKSKTLIIHWRDQITDITWGFSNLDLPTASDLSLIDIKQYKISDAITIDKLDKDKIDELLKNKKRINEQVAEKYTHLNDFEKDARINKLEFPQFFFEGEQYYGLLGQTSPKLVSSTRNIQTAFQFGKDRNFKTLAEMNEGAIAKFTLSGFEKYLVGGYIPKSNKAFEMVTKLLKRFIYFPNPETYKFLSIWIMGTYLFNNFNYFPYIHIQAPKGSGKSVLLDILSHLCFNAKYYVNPTPAVVFRDINDSLSTILFDEVESFLTNNTQRELTSVLNQGFAKKATLPRVKGDKTVQYNIFSPKAFAGISPLNDVLLSRSIKTKIEKKPSGTTLSRFTIDANLKNRFEETRNEIYLFGLYFAKKILAEYKTAGDSTELKDVDNRELDNWAPLFSIAKLVENDMPSKTLLKDLEKYIEIDRQLKGIANDSTEHDAAYFLIDYFRKTKSLSITSKDQKAYTPKELFDAIKKEKIIDPMSTINKLTKYLSTNFGIKSNSIKVKGADNTSGNKRCYVVNIAEITNKLKSYNNEFDKDDFL